MTVSDAVERSPPLGERRHKTPSTAARGSLHFQLTTAFYRVGDEGLGMQPGRA